MAYFNEYPVFKLTIPKPLEVIKTTMAANRGDSFAGAMGRIWGRGGIFGCKCPFNTRFQIYSIPASTFPRLVQLASGGGGKWTPTGYELELIARSDV
jgi:hypothetical protein